MNRKGLIIGITGAAWYAQRGLETARIAAGGMQFHVPNRGVSPDVAIPQRRLRGLRNN